MYFEKIALLVQENISTDMLNDLTAKEINHLYYVPVPQIDSTPVMSQPETDDQQKTFHWRNESFQGRN